MPTDFMSLSSASQSQYQVYCIQLQSKLLGTVVAQYYPLILESDYPTNTRPLIPTTYDLFHASECTSTLDVTMVPTFNNPIGFTPFPTNIGWLRGITGALHHLDRAKCRIRPMLVMHILQQKANAPDKCLARSSFIENQVELLD